MEQKTSPFAILGSANCDFFLEVRNFPQEGETIQANKSFTLNGGKGANQAVAAGRTFGSCAFLGQFGKDDMATKLEKEMTSSGVSLKYSKKLDGVETGHAYIILNETKQNMIIIVGGANMHYESLTELPKEYKEGIDQCEYLLLQREIPNEINLLAAKYAKEKGKTVMLDCGGRDEPFPEGLFNYIDILSPNETEALRVLETTDESKVNIENIRETVMKKYPQMKVLLKLGSHGCHMIGKDFDLKVPTVNNFNDQIMKDHPIVNTTGAGDCFTANFIVKYAELSKQDISEKERCERSMLFANTCAYICITRQGAMPSMPTMTEAQDFIKKYLSDKKI